MSGDIADAKRRLPLPELMQQLGLGEHAKKSARCPFHDDRHASFSIWQSKGGLWFFKCHTGCGDGDEINFLELHKQLSRREATKLFLEMAGVNSRRPNEKKSHETKAGTVFDWQVCIEAFTDTHVEWLARWRVFIEFCCWLKQSGLIGVYNGCIAFPVHNSRESAATHNGDVVAAHHRLKRQRCGTR